MPTPQKTAAPPSLLYLVKQLELAVRARLDDILRPAGITSLQYTALTVLERRSGLTTAGLARNSFVTDQTMAGMVNALEDRGLISRQHDQEDRRRRVILLTDAGRDVLDRFRDEVTALETRMVSGLGPDESATLRHYLGTCHAALSARPPH
ncbi:MarR family transcriptional regulator [Amycolatopsis acidiphila]|uniref:MarR family winged helix-turn-helix transcriptional regulator n=1 Tax=Amycolatopsis acidiphila TaxID=715473 RepID=UPI001E5140AC|nr:MarR family transcriptional regulator [Amycolatopsis acidiphila]UIJ63657.1 MarR family transcriptional regulator [Amycolatopsis acidiphila]